MNATVQRWQRVDIFEAMTRIDTTMDCDAAQDGEYTIAARELDEMMGARGFRGWFRRRRYERMWGMPWRSVYIRTAESINIATVAADSARFERSLTATVR